jgi:hypothetical protein
VAWLRQNPARLAASAEGDSNVVDVVKSAAAVVGLKWREANHLLLRRGPYVIAAGLDESIAGEPKALTGRFINLFDPELRLRPRVELTPGSRFFLLDLDAGKGEVLASACKVLPRKAEKHSLLYVVEGVPDTPAVVLFRASKPPRSISLGTEALANWEYSSAEKLLWIRFQNTAAPRPLRVTF